MRRDDRRLHLLQWSHCVPAADALFDQEDLRKVYGAWRRRALPVEVEVHLFANLADYGPPGTRGGAARVELPEGETVRDLLRRLRIPDEVPRLLLVNGRDVESTARLNPGDVVDVLPPLVGG